MLTLITGTPGAGKTLMAVWDFARNVPGSTIETTAKVVSHGVEYQPGDAVPRHLFTNIRDLLVEHQHISADDIMKWHEWAQPGDTILYDEVQEVWRPRPLGNKDVPPCVAALETHRHKGVDIILVTQHPMLLDSNVRRLTNKHIHLRRLMNGTSYVYEWDGCSVNPGATKSAINGRLWWFPTKAFRLYKSAQLHTKTTAKLPSIFWIGLLAVAGLAVAGPFAYKRVKERLSPPPPVVQAEKPKVTASGPIGGPATLYPVSAVSGSGIAPPPIQPVPDTPLERLLASRPAGCIALPKRCECFATDGHPVRGLDQAVCMEALKELSSVIVMGGHQSGGIQLGGSRSVSAPAPAAPGDKVSQDVVPLSLPTNLPPAPAAGVRVNGIPL